MVSYTSFVRVWVVTWKAPVGQYYINVRALSFKAGTFFKFIKPLTLRKSFMTVSRGWALKSSIIIKLSYALEKNLIIPVQDSRNCESEFKGWLYIHITIFLFSDSTQRYGLCSVKTISRQLRSSKLNWIYNCRSAPINIDR